MTAEAEVRGSLEVALEHAARLLREDPALALAQSEEILAVFPNHGGAQLLKGLALSAQGQGEAAIGALRDAVRFDPNLAAAWRALGDHLHAIGATVEADQAYARSIRAATQDPQLLRAAAALCDNQIAIAESLLREYLKQFPTDVAAIRMLAEVAARLGRYGDAENLLARCLELAPGFTAARHNYAFVLHRAGKSAEALAQVNQLLEAEPRNPGYRNLKAAILARIGEVQASIEIYGGVLAEYPHYSRVWMSYGHALKTAGRQADCIDAYRRSLALEPTLGETWWSLANLKTYRFSEADLQAMQRALARPDLGVEDRFHLHFAIGKALEDLGQFPDSFQHYQQGNTLRRQLVAYDAEETTTDVRRMKALFTREFFAQRAGWGCAAGDPIFIVGLPRSGSTLLEQILASHSMVEGTQELPDIPALARRLGGRRRRSDRSAYPEVLATMGRDELAALGEAYLADTRIHRKTDAPFFIDKLPNNWLHVGLIHLILPNARIIDARRHPLGCCFSCYKQHFARGQTFTYDLTELGRYYRDYAELMAHFDAVLPGRIHRVIYETLVDDTEGHVRRLLAYCGLPFEPGCLRFYETARAVRTASSEQVRQPIFRDAVEHWRHYEPWLGPLREALGPVLGSYPDTPHF